MSVFHYFCWDRFNAFEWTSNTNQRILLVMTTGELSVLLRHIAEVVFVTCGVTFHCWDMTWFLTSLKETISQKNWTRLSWVWRGSWPDTTDCSPNRKQRKVIYDFFLYKSNTSSCSTLGSLSRPSYFYYVVKASRISHWEMFFLTTFYYILWWIF